MSQESIDDLVKSILDALQKEDTVLMQDQKNIHGAVLKLESKNMIKYEITDEQTLVLSDEGNDVLNNGSPEVLYFNRLTDGDPVEKGIGLNHALKNKWVEIRNKRAYKLVASVDDVIQRLLERVNDQIRNRMKCGLDQLKEEGVSSAENVLTEEEIQMLKRRKLVVLRKIKSYVISKGPSFSQQMHEYATNLTFESTINDEYKKLTLKDYNFDTKLRCESGNLHPLMKIKSEIKKIFLELGFSEMPTSRYVESSFWNFDALFQPQNHPSRDVHDTFFLSNPERTKLIPTNYKSKVQDIHEESYKYRWSEKESCKNVLRTHTTACTARMLYEIGKNIDNIRTTKMFSIDRVFRNESVDATHLAEFHQIEGLVVGKNLTVGHLMGVLQKFYDKLNLKDIKFKPAYNPYTEPSLEIFAYHKKMNQWIEIGNSGVFRPEVLHPMGIKGDWRVIAWGLSLERPAMIKYNLKNIRDLLGHKVDLDFIKNCPICYF